MTSTEQKVERELALQREVFGGNDQASRLASWLAREREAEQDEQMFARAMGAPSECYTHVRWSTEKRLTEFLKGEGLTPLAYNQMMEGRVDGKWLYYSGVAIDPMEVEELWPLEDIVDMDALRAGWGEGHPF